MNAYSPEEYVTMELNGVGANILVWDNTRPFKIITSIRCFNGFTWSPFNPVTIEVLCGPDSSTLDPSAISTTDDFEFEIQQNK